MGSIAAGATTRPGARVGVHIMLAGIVFQFAAHFAYCCLAGDFIFRYTTDRPSAEHHKRPPLPRPRDQAHNLCADILHLGRELVRSLEMN
ncbi:hypothetical protein B0H14DRAFT_3460519 [Mycena olivaceomarginata]|nr:hypothetical protein B0H14DRAFT_3460519 [Mycena olivaceomarginata]